MSQIIQNQNKMIEFIKETICSVEGEEFLIENINLYHPWYKLFGDNCYTGSLLVFGNKNYMKMIEDSKNNLFGISTEKEKVNESILKFQGRARWFDINNENEKSLIIKYSPKKDASGEDCYKFKSVTNLKRHYPYLVEIIDALNKVTSDNIQVETLITELSKIVEASKKNNDDIVSSTSLSDDGGYSSRKL